MYIYINSSELPGVEPRCMNISYSIKLLLYWDIAYHRYIDIYIYIYTIYRIYDYLLMNY